MNITRKDATITNTDDAFPGEFEVILSAPTKDRDGETLLPEEWKQPLPDRITFDSDHGMSVATTVGSGVPTLNDAGELVVSGTYSSLQKAQDVRTLVNEGHIRTTSVAFMTERTPQKDGKGTVTRELLNGAFVAIPSNREALVLSSKAAVKAGARNSATDMAHIQSAHDSLASAGADCPTPPMKAFRVKAMGADDPMMMMMSACDAAIDSALDLFSQVEGTTLPAEVQQAIALIQAADVSMDEMMAAAGMPDPDETAESTAVEAVATAEKSAVATATKAAEDAESEAVRTKAADLIAASFV